ncbi:MAG TPA: serine/threonine-protein kinase [Thermoanaerobaculales bacterium]|nr:serine/threonine-protein kinase [Thermoanaerobaculales bacterium]HPA79575.1 serine/threonine-protein kinase [Thermoanaerobaculales bacterium]HQL29216.1 serine/threonine-protein kinase [Thermoanaerobaculales bacterium]HQN95632.1 serine/threonine-protein kinase [Thermoanaerobaculales bacterium]
MAANDESHLLRLAEAVSDREPVPWSDERAAAGDRGRVVDGLQRLHALARAFAEVTPADDDRDAGGPLLGRWGHLELIARLGAGSFGEVFRAHDPNLGREVALKLRRAGPGPAGDSGRRLLDEARRLARVRHPNVVTVHGADLCDGRVGIWTELIEGQTLEERLSSDGPIGPGEAITLGLDLCRALAAVHAAGLVHGDVKTANVLRERGGRIVLTDLGSSTEAGEPARTGSPATLAPEVLAGNPATPAADLYSLGVLLFRMLTGRCPAKADPASLRDLRPDLPLELVRVVEQAADPDPGRRYPSAGALEQALARLGGAAAAPSPATAPATGRWRVGVAAAAVVVVLAVAGYLLIGRLGTEAQQAPPQQPQAPAASVTTGREPALEPVAEPAPQLAAAPAAALPAPLAVQATMFRAGPTNGEPLADGDRVAPGDRLYLELESQEPVHAWVLNEDLEGAVFVLFPIDGLDLGNPLAAGRVHRLPGRLAGLPQQWQVTSAGGRERFLVIAARGERPELERELAGLVAANPGKSGRLRGVGGLQPTAGSGSGRLDAIARELAAARQRDGSIWLLRLELDNP